MARAAAMAGVSITDASSCLLFIGARCPVTASNDKLRVLAPISAEEPVHRVFKSSGASDDEVAAMRAALADADIKFEERPQTLLGGGQAGLWVSDPEALTRAKRVIAVAQEAWVQRVRADPESVQVASIFGTNKLLVWCTCVLVFVVHVVLITELFFGW